MKYNITLQILNKRVIFNIQYFRLCLLHRCNNNNDSKLIIFELSVEEKIKLSLNNNFHRYTFTNGFRYFDLKFFLTPL